MLCNVHINVKLFLNDTSCEFDIHNGFDFPQVGWITFFLSSVLDNLTSTIVMISLLRKLVKDPDQRRCAILSELLKFFIAVSCFYCKDSGVYSCDRITGLIR
jgi:hypothetical protein